MSSSAERWIAHPGRVAKRLEPPGAHPGGDYYFTIGPEGGFTEAEIESAFESGWQPIRLGPRILRIETAALALAAS